MIQLFWDGSRHVLVLLAPDGAERLRVPLPETSVQVGANASPDLLVLATAERGSWKEVEPWTSWLLNLQTGGLQKIGSGMMPAVLDAGTGSPASRLFFRDPGGLTLFDPKTGQLRDLLPGRPVEPGLWIARLRATRLPQR